MDEFKLNIEIGLIKGEDSGPSVSIRWKDGPESEYEWDDVDQAWTKICNGIHALIGELGPLPEEGYDVTFQCKNFKQLIEDITLKDYRERN